MTTVAESVYRKLMDIGGASMVPLSAGTLTEISRRLYEMSVSFRDNRFLLQYCFVEEQQRHWKTRKHARVSRSVTWVVNM